MFNKDLDLKLYSGTIKLNVFIKEIKKLSLLIKIIFALIVFTGFIPSLIVTVGGLIHEFNEIETQKIHIDDQGEISGKYVGTKNGLHYYIHENELYRTQGEIEIVP